MSSDGQDQLNGADAGRAAPEAVDADSASSNGPNAEPLTDGAAPNEITPVAAESVGGALSGFAGLNLRPELQAALTGLGYEEPTPIQREAIPLLVEGRDLIGQAATGTGKTAAFALPLLQRAPGRSKDGAPFALILVPTRELAVQVSQAIHRYGRDLGTRVVPVYGGQAIRPQLRALQHGVDVVVATPGRALDHLRRNTLSLDNLAVVVLDEADEMLDMGFSEDIEAILEAAPQERQTVLFSATMPKRIDKLAQRYLRDPERIRIAPPAQSSDEQPLVRQAAYVVSRAHKATALSRLLDIEDPAASLVFCRTREEVDQLTETLNGRGYRAEALHGGMSQEQRDRVMGRLRGGSADLLVATDVAARGLDLETLTHVFNYDVPSAPESYVHRIGRVGRAGREGVAITLTEPREHRMLKAIEQVTRRRIPVEKIPTVADLRARRLELTMAALEESLLEDGDLDSFRVVVETLAADHDIIDVALAAIKLAHEASGAAAADEEEIPEPATRPARERNGSRNAKDSGDGASRFERRNRARSVSTARVWVNSGRNDGIRPQDLVGAITGETSLRGHEIGAIQISHRFSLVEVPEAEVDTVMAGLRGTTLKGKKPKVRRERESER